MSATRQQAKPCQLARLGCSHGLRLEGFAPYPWLRWGGCFSGRERCEAGDMIGKTA